MNRRGTRNHTQDQRGKVALLTGATGGLGSAIAESLTAAGVNIVLSDRPGTPLDTLADHLRRHGIRVATVEADLTDRDAAPTLLARSEAQLGAIDILVNNAGVEFVGSWSERTPENLAFEVEINLLAPMLLTQAALPAMLSRGSGHIINISSIGGLIALPFLAGYAATKHGLAAYGRSLACELGDQGVTFTTVFPGLIRNSGMGARYSDALLSPRWHSTFTKTPEQVGAAVVHALHTHQCEVVVSATPARPSAMLTAIAPSIPIRVLRRVRDWGAPKLNLPQPTRQA